MYQTQLEVSKTDIVKVRVFHFMFTKNQIMQIFFDYFFSEHA